jgi:hypothetical protein
MCMGGGGPSRAATDQAAENARLAEERRKANAAPMQNPEDVERSSTKKESFRTLGRRGLRIDLDSQTKSGTTGLSIKG